MVLSSPLFSFQGMSLSGGEQLEAQERIVTGLTTLHPHTSTHYHICTDTFGAIATASSGEPCTLTLTHSLGLFGSSAYIPTWFVWCTTWLGLVLGNHLAIMIFIIQNQLTQAIPFILQSIFGPFIVQSSQVGIAFTRTIGINADFATL